MPESFWYSLKSNLVWAETDPARLIIKSSWMPI